MTAPSRLRVGALWRYPVKSLGAEPLDQAWLSEDGVPVDRVVHVQGSRGRARRTDPARPAHASRRDGRRRHAAGGWAPVAQRRGRRSGPGRGREDARLVGWDGPERFDVANLLVATDGAVRCCGHDVHRLRPNLLLGGTDEDEEVGWPGRALAVGEAVVGLLSRRARCIVTSIDPVSGEQDLDAFRRVRQVFDNQLGLDAWVRRPGLVRVGDKARMIDTDRTPKHVGGWVVGAPYEVPELSAVRSRPPR